jgi:putative ABC transport system permease protein
MSMESLVSDSVAAAKRLTKTPRFVLAVTATLAIAIGANTIIFSVLDDALLRPLPFGNAARLFAVVSSTPSGPSTVSVPDLVDWRQQSSRLDGFAAYGLSPGNLTGRGDPVRLNAALVTANWFSLLGVQPERGRGFAPNEDTPQATKVVILSDALWRSRFGASKDIRKQTLEIDGDAYTVVDVAPPRFTYPSTPDIWVPLVNSPESFTAAARGQPFLNVVGRIANGTPESSARQEFATVTERLRQQYPQDQPPICASQYPDTSWRPATSSAV